MDLSIKIGTNILKNPIGVASGTFGYGSEYEELIDFSYIGAIYTKAVTPSPKQGNEIPRIIETPSGLLNSIGLANVGLEKFISEKLPQCSKYSSAIIVNVAGSTKDEYVYVLEKLEECKGIWGYEINVSCPNVKQGGMAFGTDPLTVENLTKSLRAITRKPLIVKLTPNFTDIRQTAKACEIGGADAVSCINTVVGMVIDVNNKKPILPQKTGGLSGPAIRPIGVAMVYLVKRSISIPVIGIGGIMNTEDALQYLLAGASAIQIGTANFVDPSIASIIYKGIISFCEKEGIKNISQLHHYID
jgi:dihydroorotate dehydrogenase (NAD+) catalytic subunit